MGKGIQAARDMGSGLHADVLDDFKDQLLIVLMKRLQRNGVVRIPVSEVDNTGHDVLSFAVRDGVFHFHLSKKA